MRYGLIAMYLAAAIGFPFTGMGQEPVQAPLPEIKDVVVAQGPAKPPPLPPVKDISKKNPRGYKLAPLHVRQQRHKDIEHRRVHFKHAKKFLAAPDSFDCEAKGWTIPVSDQGDCGSCHDHSAREVASCAFLVAGVFKAPWNGLSIQALMNCYPEGGNCNGGDEWADCQFILQNGLPTADDYPGPGQGTTGPCSIPSTMKRYKPGNMAYVSADAGMPTAEELMSAMVLYGPISVAGAAGSDWDGVTCDTVISGNSDSVNHAYIYTKYKKDKGKVYFFLQNSWTKSWGCNGGAWILHGADSSGTEAFYCHVTPVDPAPPTPPSPIPPGPPTPPPPLAGTMTITVTGPMGNWTVEGLPVGTTDTLGKLIAIVTPPAPAPVPPLPPASLDAKVLELQNAVVGINASLLEIRNLLKKELEK